MDSILQSVKKMLGMPPEYTAFDVDIIIHINSVFMILNQLGVGPENGFSILDETAVWTDYISENNKNFEAVKSYIYLKVRLLFDPPMSSAVMECMKQMINEMEFRLNVAAETNRKGVEENEPEMFGTSWY